MTDQYLRLAERPALRHPGYPTCDACDIETDHEDGDWLCPSCGTVWPGDNLEADAADATLYPDWSGETLTGPVCPNDLAWRVAGIGEDAEDRDRRVRRLIAEANHD